jgi:hypothetical protein
MKFVKHLTVIVLVTLIFACAMITKGPVQEIEFTSNTDSVTVYVDGKDIGQTPTSESLWKIKKHTATFYFPDGQEQEHQLKTHPNRDIINNGLLLLVDPYLGIIGFGVDWFAGSGRSFDERTLRFENLKTGMPITVDITAKTFKPKDYGILFGGAGILPIMSDKDNDRLEKTIPFPDVTFEVMRSYRGRYHLGAGINLQYIDRLKAEEDKILNNVFQLTGYGVFKFSPVKILDNVRPYLVNEIGTGISFGKDNGKSTMGLALIYWGGGWGIEYKEKIYAEIIGQFRLFDVIWGEGLALGNVRYIFRVGFRFDPKKG